MADTGKDQSKQGEVATHDALLHILGEIDDEPAAEILALEPTVAELEQAAMWIMGKGDVVDRAGHALAGKTAQIVEILSAEEPEEER